MNNPKTSSEDALFFRQWLRSPKAMGSVTPSSRALARAVAAEVAWQRGQTVVELGAGTGAITEGLLERGIPREALLVIELDASLCDYLKRRLPGVPVVQGDATRLGEILEEHGIKDVSTVVCGLPMVPMSLDFQRRILEQSFAAMPEGASVIQYSYSPVPPIRHRQLGIKAKLEKYVLYNLPPAAVWRFTRGRGNGAAHAHS